MSAGDDVISDYADHLTLMTATTRRVYLHEGATGWVESTDVPGVWSVRNDCTPAGPAWGDLVRLEPELDDAAYALAEHLPRAVPVRLPDPRPPDPWEGMTDEHWAALAAVFPLPDPVGGHGDVLAELGKADGPTGAAMRARRLLGLARYGVPLRFGDGRPPGVDALQEAVDIAGYQVRDHGVPPNRSIRWWEWNYELVRESIERIDRAALADAWWGLDTVHAAGVRTMVEAAVAGVDLPADDAARARGEESVASEGPRVDLPSPCPWCGPMRDGGNGWGRIHAYALPDGEVVSWSVTCCGCAAEGPWAKSEAGALAAWSRRPPGGRAS